MARARERRRDAEERRDEERASSARSTGRSRAERRSAQEPAPPGAERAAAIGRPMWSGSITFGLVTVPVELVAAQRRVGPSFRLLSPAGHPLERQYVCPRDERPLARDEIARGYEVEKDEFVLVGDDELEQLAPRSSRDIDLTQFVPSDAIDPSFFVRSYFVLPSGGQTRAYRLLAETMEATGRAALARFVMRGKGYAVALFAERGILRAQTLRFHDEVRRPEDLDLTAPIEVEAARVRRMAQAIEALAAPAVPEAELVEADADVLLARAREKLVRGEDVVRLAATVGGADEEEAATGDVIDLMAALKERLGQKRAPSRATPQKERAPKSATKKKPAAAARGGERRSRRTATSRSR